VEPLPRAGHTVGDPGVPHAFLERGGDEDVCNSLLQAVWAYGSSLHTR
jgi:hypothetical protein